MNKKIKVTDSMGTILVTFVWRTLNDTLVYCGLPLNNCKSSNKIKSKNFGDCDLRGIHEKDVISIIEI